MVTSCQQAHLLICCISMARAKGGTPVWAAKWSCALRCLHKSAPSPQSTKCQCRNYTPRTFLHTVQYACMYTCMYDHVIHTCKQNCKAYNTSSKRKNQRCLYCCMTSVCVSYAGVVLFFNVHPSVVWHLTRATAFLSLSFEMVRETILLSGMMVYLLFSWPFCNRDFPVSSVSTTTLYSCRSTQVINIRT